MQLFACGLCSGEEPFVCGSRFRRTYMRLHLEKAHGVAAEVLKLSRKTSASDNQRATWFTMLNGKLTCVLIEFQIETATLFAGLPESEIRHVVTSSSSADTQDAGDNTSAIHEPWTPSAMQDLYRTREGAGAGF